MAKYDVMCSCGHAETHQIVGPHSKRQYRTNKLEQQLCSACYNKKVEQDRSTAAAEAKNTNSDMVSLTGSEKQIKWAEQIRANARTAVEKLLGFATLTEIQQQALNTLWGQSSAAWWIDHRIHGDFAHGWLNEAAKLVKK